MTGSAKQRIIALLGLVLAILVTGHTEGNSMATVDPQVTEKLKQAGDRSVPVLIVCGDACDSVRKALDKAGVKISSTESMVLGSIGAEITADQMETVKSIPGISYIEFDEEAKALHNR